MFLPFAFKRQLCTLIVKYYGRLKTLIRVACSKGTLFFRKLDGRNATFRFKKLHFIAQYKPIMKRLIDIIKKDSLQRPWWMNLIFYFCVYMTLVYMPFDIFIKPVEADHEVWFGLTLTGWWAKATAPLHWLIYGFGAYGFWKMKPWMWPWAAVYAAQVVVAMLVWNVISVNGKGVLAGIITATLFSAPMLALWASKTLFERK